MDNDVKNFYKSYINGKAKFVKRKDTDPKIEWDFNSPIVNWVLQRYLWVSTIY